MQQVCMSWANFHVTKLHARTIEQNYTHVYDATARGEKDGMLVYRRADAITEAWKDTGIVLI